MEELAKYLETLAVPDPNAPKIKQKKNFTEEYRQKLRERMAKITEQNRLKRLQNQGK